MITVPAEPAPWYRALGLPLLAAVAAGLAASAFGAPLTRAIGIGLVGGTVLFLFLRGLDLQPRQWPEPEPVIDTPLARGGRWKVDALDRVREYPEAFGHRLKGRLRAIVVAALSRRSVAWSDPATSSLLGADVRRLLDETSDAAPDPAGLSTVIGRVVAVATDPTAARPLHVPDALQPRARR